MPQFDATTNQIKKEYSIEELKEKAQIMRAYDLIALCAAGSGHAGGTLSIMDITAALYLQVANYDPTNPSWDGRDRIFWSAGHKAPSLYLGLGIAGYFDIDEIVTLRKYNSPFQGHPHWLKLPGVEISSGSLGQGLSVAVGSALAAKLDNKDYSVYTIHGDGELQEGQIWEAAMEAAHYGLDNLIAIVDKNDLQIDGNVCDVMSIEPLTEKWQSFGWEVIEINGHDMQQIMDAFTKAKQVKGKPTVIIAKTVKGKGVDFMENQAGWHGKAPSREELDKALPQLELKQDLPVDDLLKKASDFQLQADSQIQTILPSYSKNYFWNKQSTMKAEMDPTRKGFGQALQKNGEDERIVCLGLDISGSILINQFCASNPERNKRFCSMGIAEQSGTAVAAGLAKEGKLPVVGTYGVFASGRALDQIRTTIAYSEVNVFIAGAHGGISVGPDGATHQALEEIATINAIPNMNLEVPCDSVETERACEELLLRIKGPKYVRFAREATPIVTTMDTPYVFGKANVIRYRGEKENFIEAFETTLADQYANENEDICLIACGPELAESMRAAYILKEEFGIESRILNIHTVKPLDKAAVIKATAEVGKIITAEEHQVGGFGGIISTAIHTAPEVWNKSVAFDMIGVQDRFGESGAPWELMKAFGLTAEFIAEKARHMLKK